MKIKSIILVSILLVVALVLVKIIPLAWLFTAGLREPVTVPDPENWPTDGWLARSPEELGFDSGRLAKMLLALQENDSTIDSLLILHEGYVVLDAHFSPYNGKFPHDMASVTKSVMTTLVAIAADQGYIDLDRPALSYFPNWTIANLDQRKQHMTVRHLMENTNGMQSGCLEGDEPTLDRMRAEPDWVQAALNRPMAAEPGAEFCYDSPGFHILSAILQAATGLTTLDFARQNLFEPLGIQKVVWESDPQGYTRGWGDLHLLPQDAAKIGFLFLHRGEWDGQQIVSEAWMLDAVQAHSRSVGDDYGYGYGWWISPVGYYAVGRGGQNIRVFASLNTVVVTTGGDFDFPEIEPSLTPILLQLRDSRPADPQGQAALAAALAEISYDPVPTASISPTDLVQAVSDMTFLCADNPAGIETIRANFDEPLQTRLSFRISGTEYTWPVGLDGEYRFTLEGTAIRGGWEDERTFQFTVFDVGVLTRRLIFAEDQLQIVFPEADLTIACQAKKL